MKRKIIEIDEEKCNGCGLCIPNCAEGALQLIDGKVRLIGDLFCDGLGACIGHCPEEAIEIVEREAAPYREEIVMRENIVPAGQETIRAHLEHLREHGETEYFQQAVAYLKNNNIPNPLEEETNPGDKMSNQKNSGCPGMQARQFHQPESQETKRSGALPTQLRQWPIQLHLLSPSAPFFKDADILLAADCTAFSLGDFHEKFLRGKFLAIACPKLDVSQEIYLEKLTAMIDESNINTITVMIMEVPCCRSLAALAQKAVERALRKIPVKRIVVGIQGSILSEEWL